VTVLALRFKAPRRVGLIDGAAMRPNRPCALTAEAVRRLAIALEFGRVAVGGPLEPSTFRSFSGDLRRSIRGEVRYAIESVA
jgi:hypothetical protein